MASRSRVQVSITADNSSLRRGVAESEASLGRLTTAGEKAAGNLGSKAKEAASSWTSLAKGAAEAAIAFASVEGAKIAIETTDDLARSALKLHRNLGLTIEDASRFAGVAKARGIDSKQMAQAFGTLSKQVQNADAGSKKATETFKQLGVSQDVLKRGKFDEVLHAVADGMGRMQGGTQRAALGMTLFGRGWQTLLPLMSEGSKTLDEQLKLADKYGVTFHGKTVKSMEELVAAQREARFATLGLQISFGTYLAPALTKITKGVADFVGGMRDGTGAGGRFASAIRPIAHTLSDIAQFLGAHPKLIEAAVIAWGAYKAAGVAAAAITRAKLLASFVGLGRRAAVGGAEAGVAFGGAASTAASAEMTKFNWRSVGTVIGGLIGPVVAGLIAAEIYSKLTAGTGLSTGTGDVIPGGSIGVTNPKNPRQTIFVHPTKGGKVVDQGGHSVPGLGKTPPKVHPVKKHLPRAGTASVGGHTASVGGHGATAHAAASGRPLSLPQLASLWVQAGGPSKVAMLMAHVAMAESGGNPTARNPSGASGLWQILGQPFPGDVFDPLTNARMAVWKYKNQGLGAWAASRGSWGQYVGANEGLPAGARVPVPSGGGASAPVSIAPPRDTTSAFDLQSAQYDAAAARAALTPGSADDNAAKAVYRRQVQAQLRRVQQALRSRRLSRGRRVSLLQRETDLYGRLGQVAPSRTTGALGPIRWGPDPKRAAALEQQFDANLQGLQNKLDFTDAQVAAGDITDAQGAQQKINLIDSALRGGFGQISPEQMLALRGTERQIQQDAASAAGSQNDAALQAQQEAIAAMQALTSAINTLKDEEKRHNDIVAGVQGVDVRQATRFAADVLSGEIAGRVAGKALTAGAGTVFRA